MWAVDMVVSSENKKKVNTLNHKEKRSSLFENNSPQVTWVLVKTKPAYSQGTCSWENAPQVVLIHNKRREILFPAVWR